MHRGYVLFGFWLVLPACGSSERAGSGGSAGFGGTESVAAVGGAAAGSNAGMAGARAGAGAPGVCHREPDLTPSLPAPNALDPDWVARAAAVLGSCVPDDGVPRNAAHLWLEHLGAPRIYFRLGEQLDCLANAGCGCSAVEHCLGLAYRAAPSACASSCSGDVFTGCGDGAELTLNCSRFGLGCDPAANCVAEAAVACAGSLAPSCSAQGEVTFCDDGFLRKTPCQALGYRCVDGQCVGAGDTCSSDSSSSQLEQATPVGTGCSGATLQACLGGHSTSIDCATQGSGFTCQSLGSSFFCGLAAECMPASNSASAEAATCDGTTLSFCNAGRLEHLDCAALGFSGCELDRALGHYGCTPGATLQ